MAGEREVSEILLFSAEGPGANEHTGFAGWRNNSSRSPCFVLPQLFSSAGWEYLSRYFIKWNDLLSSERAHKSGISFDKNMNKPTKMNPTVGFVTTGVKTNPFSLGFLWEDTQLFLESSCIFFLPLISLRVGYSNSYINNLAFENAFLISVKLANNIGLLWSGSAGELFSLRNL